MMFPFFDRYTEPYLSEILLYYRYLVAIDKCIEFLNHVKQFSPTGYDNISKGTPFYWMGLAVFRSHDFQTATFLFDAAVSEDLKYHPNDPNQPSLLTMQLKRENPHQAALEVVTSVVHKIEEAITDYNNRGGSKPLSFNDTQQHFLTPMITGGNPRIR
jgi:hypothetical protein